MDQDDIIDNILNEDSLQLDYNKKNYDINDIINEGLDKLLDNDDFNNNKNEKGEKENEKEKEKEKEKESQNEEKQKVPINQTLKDSKDIINETKKEKNNSSSKEIAEKKIEKEKNEKDNVQKEINKKKKEESKKIENFYPPFKNPLDFIQYLEIDGINAQISSEMKNFILQNHRKKDNKYELSKIISLSQISSDISKLDVIAIYAKSNNLLLWTMDGNLLFYSIKGQKLLKKINPKNIKNSYINCLDITDEFTEILCGYQDGTIALIHIFTEEVKYINNKIHKDVPCIEIKIYKKVKNDLYFVSSGGDNQIFYNTLKMNVLSNLFWRCNSEPIKLDNKTPVFLIKFITFSLENKKSYTNIKKLKRYVILGSLELISIYCVEPLTEIFVIKKPDFIKENVVPDAQIGIGRPPEVVIRFAKKDEKNHLLLIISWGKIIFFYQLPIVNEDSINSYKELGYYINLFNILRIGFMNISIIYCLDKSFAIKFLESSKINPGKVNLQDGKPVIPKNNNLAEIEKSRLVSANIYSQMKVIESNDHPKETYLYSILENNDSIISVVVLGEKQLYNVALNDWESFLNYLQKKEDFLNLFTIGIELFKGKMLGFTNIPSKKNRKKLVGDFLKQIISQYVILNTGEKKATGLFLGETEDLEKISQCIKMVIEVCIEIEAVEFLFKSIEPLFESKDYGELFLTTLQPFILCDKIKNVVLSSDIILNLIELYKKIEKLDILSQMLLHININSIDTVEIKAKLEEMCLITPLIYLYMNGQNEDYFAPLEKMFDFFYNRAIPSSKILINEEDNSIDYTNALRKKLITPKDIINCKEYNGHKILWYIRYCLTGKKFPDSSLKMDKNLFDALVPKITYWLLNHKVIDEFLKFDPKNYFMIHKNIFTIEDLYKKLVNSAKDTKYAIEVKTILSTSDIKIDDIEPNSLINYMVNWCKKKNEKKIYFYLYDFIISILNSEQKIEKELKIESICFILKHYVEIVKHINNQEVKSMNNNLIKLFEKEKDFIEEDFKQILYSINDNIFDELKLYLFDKIHYFDECLKLYLHKDFTIPGKSSKLYKWINDKLILFQKDEYKYDKLKETIKDNILPLAKLSLNKFFELTKDLFQGNNKEIVKKLEGDKELQLNYIELLIKYIIRTYENNENNVPVNEMEDIKYILETHIYLLCELNKHDKIIPCLKSCPFYPLRNCLKSCERFKAYQPCLFLYLKEGAIEKAFEMANEKLDNTFNNLINNINNENDDLEQENLLNEFMKYLTDIKNICENNELNLEDLWFQILETLYKYEMKVNDLIKNNTLSKNKKKNADDLEQNILNNIKELMEKMCAFVSIKRILEFVSEKNKNAGFKEFRDLLMKILSSYSNLTNILDSARNLLTNLVLENEQYFQMLNLKGELLNARKCLKCKQKFNKNIKEKILIFNCNHVFHKDCCISNGYEEEVVCPICSELEFINNEDKNKSSLINKSVSVIENNNRRDNKFQIKIADSAKKTLQKLERYDDRYVEKHIIMINNSITVLNDQYRKGYK